MEGSALLSRGMPNRGHNTRHFAGICHYFVNGLSMGRHRFRKGAATTFSTGYPRHLFLVAVLQKRLIDLR
jgi:hypothetical protein